MKATPGQEAWIRRHECNPKADNVVLGSHDRDFATQKLVLHDMDAGNKDSVNRQASVRRNIRERGCSIERKRVRISIFSLIVHQ